MTAASADRETERASVEGDVDVAAVEDAGYTAHVWGQPARLRPLARPFSPDAAPCHDTARRRWRATPT